MKSCVSATGNHSYLGRTHIFTGISLNVQMWNSEYVEPMQMGLNSLAKV